MINILVVDDEYNKTKLISDLLRTIDENVYIEHVTTSQAARRKTREMSFDFMLIDINLPTLVGSAPNSLGGIELFDMLIIDPHSKIPMDIAFITEKEDSIEEYQNEASKRGITLCRFDSLNDSWKVVLAGKLKLMLVRSKRNLLNSPTVDVAIVTALRDPEMEAVLQLPYEWRQTRFHDDPTGYHFGEKKIENSVRKVVVASTNRKGMPSASALAMKMVERFKPKIIVMLGICAGVKGKVCLGDIIIADPTWDWGSGKMTQDDSGSSVFIAAPHQVPLESHLSQIAQEIGNDRNILASIVSGWKNDVPEGKLRVHIGPLASGAMVLASDSSLASITTQNRDLIGVDMEAYAVMAASDYARKTAPICLVIKSVSDYADSSKTDSWQEYASYTSAQFFDRLLSNEFLPF
ncbi:MULTISPECIES: response regulator [unclassified Enterobacter]|uniref:phosphorylase family protein n=1 Tax=unclassified Enterobacter TaxID=2608935 RepID=UPI003B43C455